MIIETFKDIFSTIDTNNGIEKLEKFVITYLKIIVIKFLYAILPIR